MTADVSGQSWIAALKRGEKDAAQRLFEEYFLRLVGLARKKLQALPPRMADPSGAALSAMNNFFQGARRNAFPRLNDRNDLWRLLVVITARKAAHALRDASRQKRGGGRARGESAIGIDSDFNGSQQALSAEPTPEMAAILAEELDHRLRHLNDELLVHIARLKFDGFSTIEIATEMRRTPRTIERKLELIREIWKESP
jgi:DNA-directed RNA polymerase specialized sigma24 family protein